MRSRGCLQRRDDPLSPGIEQTPGVSRRAEAGIDEQLPAIASELLDQGELRQPALDSVQIGDVQRCEPVSIADRPGEAERIGRVREGGDDRSVLVASTGAALHDDAVSNIENWDYGRAKGGDCDLAHDDQLESGVARRSDSETPDAEVRMMHSSDRIGPGSTAAASSSMTRRPRRRGKVLILLLIMPVTLVGLLTFLQRRLIYVPMREPITRDMAGEFADRLRDVEITSTDGIALKGWLVKGGGDATAERADDRPLIIYFQGNAAHRGRRSKQFGMFCELGCDVLIVDYRGYGENAGSPSEPGLNQDADAVWRYATEELNRPAGQIILFGESLGGGVATGLASRLCDREVVPGGLVIRASFSSLVDAARYHYPWLPVDWLLYDRFPSVDRIASISCPIMVMHGDQDRIVPFEQGAELYSAAPERAANGIKKRFVRLSGAGHNDILYVAADQVRSALEAFLGEVRSLHADVNPGR